MRRILALDPGSAQTGWVLMDATGAVLHHGLNPNETLLELYRDGSVNEVETFDAGDGLVLEFMAPRGMPTSEQEFDALWWAGRFTEAIALPVVRISRQEVKRVLLGRANVKGADAAVRQVLIDRYAAGGGKEAAIGLKRNPGPLYGIRADEWAALALACAYRDDARDIETERAERAAKKRGPGA